MKTTFPSEKARAGSWHVWQATVPSTDASVKEKLFTKSDFLREL